jgi:hypothetical protein
MRIRLTVPRHYLLSTFCLCALLTGCRGTRVASDYVPSQNKARTALETALEAWRSGKKMGLIADAKPAVQVMDSKWQAGQKLESFEILEAEAGTGPQWFKVKLKMKAPAGEQQVRYVVAGIDPLWVYREEDYKKAAGTGS